MPSLGIYLYGQANVSPRALPRRPHLRGALRARHVSAVVGQTAHIQTAGRVRVETRRPPAG